MSFSFFLQLDLQPVAERIDNLSPPTDVFRAVAENAVQLSGSESASNDLLDELCSNENLASVSIRIFDVLFVPQKLHFVLPKYLDTQTTAFILLLDGLCSITSKN